MLIEHALKLLPCPWCGGPPATYDSRRHDDDICPPFMVTCEGCGAQKQGPTLAETADAWNKRHVDVSKPAVEVVNHPNHYNHGRVEVAVAMDVLGPPAQWLGHALKYACRAPHKGKLKEDLKKAIWCARHACELNATWGEGLSDNAIVAIARALVEGIPDVTVEAPAETKRLTLALLAFIWRLVDVRSTRRTALSAAADDLETALKEGFSSASSLRSCAVRRDDGVGAHHRGRQRDPNGRGEPVTSSAENLAAQIRVPCLLRETVRKYVGTPPMTADARAHWSEVCKQVRNPNLTRADVELAAHVTGLLVHPVRLARMEREDASA